LDDGIVDTLVAIGASTTKIVCSLGKGPSSKTRSEEKSFLDIRQLIEEDKNPRQEKLYTKMEKSFVNKRIKPPYILLKIN
jgi:hypothetical protein